MSNVFEALQRARYPFGHDDLVARRSLLDETRPASDPIKPIPVTARPEHFRQAIAVLHGAIRPMLERRCGPILHIVAATDQEGTSTIARELALLVAASGSRTLLVDANSQNFGTARWFGCPNGCGFINCLRQQADYHDLLRSVPNTLLSVGCLIDDNGLASIETEALRALYEKFREHFAVTIIDCPPIGRGGYSMLLPEAADGILLVIRAEKANRAAVASATEVVHRTGGNIIGAVFNIRHNYVPSYLDGVL
jgi:Mrp family chromosome partitioning ATPase